MRYVSTRGGAGADSFFEALLAGLAADGGLFMPQSWPRFSPEEIAAFAGRPYPLSAARVLEAFVGEDMAAEDLERLCADAYASFADPAVAPLEELEPGRLLLDLRLGPTLAFKDIALQVLARLFDAALTAGSRRAMVVCATSGDTGGAAAEAFRGRDNVRLVALYPAGRISPQQRRFMTTVAEKNVRAVAVDGDFDACQAIVKALFADAAFARAVSLSGINSINFARIACQSVYYFTAAAALAPALPTFVVPTGNFGDAFSALAAGRMGLRMKTVLVATNANAIIVEALASGRYRRAAAVATQSPAMDIQAASNFERLYFECSGRDGAATRAAFERFSADGTIDLPGEVLACARERLRATSVSEEETSSAIRQMWEQRRRLIDPHTAVAVWAARSLPSDRASPVVILATADAAKFPDAVRAACGVAPPVPAPMRDLDARRERLTRLPAEVEAVKDFVRDFSAAA